MNKEAENYKLEIDLRDKALEDVNFPDEQVQSTLSVHPLGKNITTNPHTMKTWLIIRRFI